MASKDKNDIAAVAISAIAPLIEFLLELGVTSPQAESLFRSVFVHEAQKWLARKNKSGRPPSDARVALITGVHRNFVRDLLLEAPKIAKSRQRKRGGAHGLLKAWSANPRYLDGSGRPRDLPIRGAGATFQALAAAYLPGSAPGVIMDELCRSGAVEELPGGRVRLRDSSGLSEGITLSNISDFALKVRALMRTLMHNLQFPGDRIFVQSIKTVAIEADRVAVIREVLNQRAAAFLARIEQEFAGASQIKSDGPRRRMKKVGLTIFST
ncbi:MAG TPA: DUF6502 family protein [Steroidobacteraceae bacterium]|nr:DUF6502 family protein [Steroidobacteraceae bacterium]